MDPLRHPFASHDLEDILAIVTSREGIVWEVRQGDRRVMEFVASECSALLSLDTAEDMLAANLSHSLDETRAVGAARQRVQGLAALLNWAREQVASLLRLIESRALLARHGAPCTPVDHPANWTASMNCR